MFDYTHEFEELPIRIDGHVVALVNGSATLESDEGYGFIVTAIDLERLDGEGVVCLSEKDGDVKWFRELAATLEADKWAGVCFDEAINEYREAA